MIDVDKSYSLMYLRVFHYECKWTRFVTRGQLVMDEVAFVGHVVHVQSLMRFHYWSHALSDDSSVVVVVVNQCWGSAVVL